MIISYKLNWIFLSINGRQCTKISAKLLCFYYPTYYCGAHLSWIHFAMGFHTAILELWPTIIPCVLPLVSGCLRCKWHSRVLLQVKCTIRSLAGITPSVRRVIEVGSIVLPAIFATCPLAGLLAVYHSNRQVRAISAANGTPSLSQSSSATKFAASRLFGFNSENSRNLFQPKEGSR